jgi:hypothetical protein
MATEGITGKGCQFKSKLGVAKICPHPLARGKFCVFHAPKTTSKEMKALSTLEAADELKLDKLFRQELSKLLDEMESRPEEEALDFSEFEFPGFTLERSITRKVIFTMATFYQELNCSNITFHKDADFSLAQFKEGADFSHVTFEQDANFYGARFYREISDKHPTGSANFTLATFNGDANFGHSDIRQPAYFAGATFAEEKNATFSPISFNEETYFQGAKFRGWTTFQANFEKEANFSDAKFFRTVSFKGSIFSKSKKTNFRSAKFFSVDFTDIVFQNGVDFSDSKYAHAATFNYVTFTERANFHRAFFRQMAYFKGACFPKGANFSEVFFNHIAQFSDATFAGKTRFVRSFEPAFFEGDIDMLFDFFGIAEFRRLIVEEGAEIIFDRVNLSQATFLDTNVEGFIFRDVRWFHPESRFKRWFRDALVGYIRKQRGADAKYPSRYEGEDIRDRQYVLIRQYFRKLEDEISPGQKSPAAQVKGGAEPEEKQEKDEGKESAIQPIEGTRENKAAKQPEIRVTFRDRIHYRLRKFLLKWTDPNIVTKYGFGRRQALWDEFYVVIDESEKTDEKIAENYRQLVLNYEKNRDYDSAENFHFGEMHMRRRSKESTRKRWNLARWINGHSIYWFSSAYGTSYRRALLNLILVFLLISAAFLYSGFQITDPSSGAVVRTVEYGVLHRPGYQTVSFGQWLKDYGQAALYALTTVTFQKGDYYRPLDATSRLWLTLGTLAFAGQAALFFLAIRRRFKR